MVNGIEAWLEEARGPHVLHSPVVAMYIIALNLVRRSGCTN